MFIRALLIFAGLLFGGQATAQQMQPVLVNPYALFEKYTAEEMPDHVVVGIANSPIGVVALARIDLDFGPSGMPEDYLLSDARAVYNKAREFYLESLEQQELRENDTDDKPQKRPPTKKPKKSIRA